MCISITTFVLYIPTDLEYHLQQEFQKYFVKFGFYLLGKKVSMQFFTQVFKQNISKSLFPLTKRLF